MGVYCFSLQSAPVCSGTTLTFTDITAEDTILMHTNLTYTSQRNISFTAKELRENRHYRINITATNAAGQATSAATLSKDNGKM